MKTGGTPPYRSLGQSAKQGENNTAARVSLLEHSVCGPGFGKGACEITPVACGFWLG